MLIEIDTITKHDTACLQITLDEVTARHLLTVLFACYRHYPALEIRDGSIGNSMDCLYDRLSDYVEL